MPRAIRAKGLGKRSRQRFCRGSGLGLLALIGLLAWGQTVRADDNAQGAAQLAAVPASADDLIIVDCRLPPRVRKLGKTVVYQVPGRLIRTPAQDCSVRGGEYTKFDASRTADAIKLWLEPAQDGDAQAQANLAALYERFDPPDYQLAAVWYQKSVDGGHAPAMVSLGRLYELGFGVPKDPVKALNLYRQAAGLTEGSLSLVTSAEEAVEVEQLRDKIRDQEQEIDRLQGNFESSKREIELLRRLLEQQEESQSGGSSGQDDSATLRRMIEDLEAQLAEHKNKIIAARQQVANVDPPKIDIVYPLATRGKEFRGLRLRTKGGTNEIVGRVHAPAGIAKVSAAREPIKVDQGGYFMIPYQWLQESGQLKIEAVDFLGRATELEIGLWGAQDDQKPTRTDVDVAGTYHALVIGNSRFQYWDSIDNAVRDAEAVAQILETKYGFQTTLLRDVSRREMLSAFNDLRERLTPEDRLLVYYAGHGHLVEQIDRGYWIPTDAETQNNAQWILNEQITDYLQIIPSRQILVIADSCYSGVLTRTSIQRPKPNLESTQLNEALRQLGAQKVRTVMTSGGVQPVLDSGPGGHSVFTSALLTILRDNDGVLEANRLFDAIYPRVLVASRRMGYQQTPTYRAIKFAGHEGGDFLFVPQK